MSSVRPFKERDAPRTTPRSFGRAALPMLFVLLLIVLAMVAAAQLAESDAARAFAERYGYAGVFGLAVVSGFNLVVPIPAVTLMPVFITVGLDFTATVLVIAAGMTVADVAAFLVGTSGARLLDARRKNVAVIERMRRFRERHAALPLIAMFAYASAAPLPNEVLAIPLGLMGYRIRDIALPLLVGNLIFNVVAALAIVGAFNAL